MKSVIFIFIIAFCLGGCVTKVTQSISDITAAAATATPVPTYACSDYGTNSYDDYTDCITTSGANCTPQNQTLPTGNIITCYVPPIGWEYCLTYPGEWVYTNNWTQATSHGVGITDLYVRSLLRCSSTFCACVDPIVTECCYNTGGATVANCGDDLVTNRPTCNPVPL